MLNGSRQSNFGERATDELAKSGEAALQHGSGAAGDTYVACLRTPNATIDVLIRFLRSCAKYPSRSLPRAVSLSRVDWLRSRPYSVTAPAIASSRQRFSTRKSSVLMGASVCTASSVMA